MARYSILRIVALVALVAQVQPLAGAVACALMRRAPAAECEGMAPEQSGAVVTAATDGVSHSPCAALGPCARAAWANVVETSYAVAAAPASVPAPARVVGPASFVIVPIPPPPLV